MVSVNLCHHLTFLPGPVVTAKILILKRMSPLAKNEKKKKIPKFWDSMFQIFLLATYKGV